MKRRKNTELPAGAPWYETVSGARLGEIYTYNVLKVIEKVLQYTYPSLGTEVDTEKMTLAFWDHYHMSESRYTKKGAVIAFDPASASTRPGRPVKITGQVFIGGEDIGRLEASGIAGRDPMRDTLSIVVAVLQDLEPIIASVFEEHRK